MRLLQVESIEKLFKDVDFKNYDVVIVRDNFRLGSMCEGKKLHVVVTSESPALGILKSIDKYLQEKRGLTPLTLEVPPLGEIGFIYQNYWDPYRVYFESTQRARHIKNILETGEFDPKYVVPEFDPDYVLQIENCARGRLALREPILEFEIAEIERIYKLSLYNIKRAREVLVKSPVVWITGKEGLISDLIHHLEKMPLEEIRTYYEYPLTEEEKIELKRLKDKENEEYFESALKMFLIANELGWLSDEKTIEARKYILEWMRKEK